MTHPRLTAQLYTVREFTQTAEDFRASMEKVADIGYTAVQVSAIGPIPHEEVKAITDEFGLAICITHVGFDYLQNDMADAIAQHKLWACPNVAVGSMPQAYRQAGEAGLKQFAKDATAVGKQLADAGLTFSYHNHSFEFARYGARTGLDVIYEESDPRYLMAELDTYWVQHGGGDVICVDRQAIRPDARDPLQGHGDGRWPADDGRDRRGQPQLDGHYRRLRVLRRRVVRHRAGHLQAGSVREPEDQLR